MPSVTPIVWHSNTSKGSLPPGLPRGIKKRMNDHKSHPEIARRLRALREAFSDRNRQQWAEMNGFNATQYTNWENGFRRIPIDAAERLVLRYGVSLDWIYLGRLSGLTSDAMERLRNS